MSDDARRRAAHEVMKIPSEVWAQCPGGMFDRVVSASADAVAQAVKERDQQNELSEACVRHGCLYELPEIHEQCEEDKKQQAEEIARLRATEHELDIVAIKQAVRAERERCAQTAQDMWHGLIAPADAAIVAEALRREPEEPSDG